MMEYYISALDKIRLEDTEKDKAKALFFQKTEEEKERFWKIRKIRKPAAAVAAVAVILTVCLQIPDLKNGFSDAFKSVQDDNHFIITAYAKELTKSRQVYAGSSESGVGGFSSSGTGQIDFEFHFPLECEGDHIDKITYTIQNGVFRITNPAGDSIVTDGVLAEQQVPVGCGFVSTETVKFDESDFEIRQYHSFTVDYDRQKDDRTYIGVADASQMWDQKKLDQYQAIGYDLKDPDIKKEKELCDFLTKDMGITCTVTYQDGTTETKNIVVSNKIVMMSELRNIRMPEDKDWAVVVRCFGIQ